MTPIAHNGLPQATLDPPDLQDAGPGGTGPMGQLAAPRPDLGIPADHSTRVAPSRTSSPEAPWMKLSGIAAQILESV
jgi:hypothetical protein